jgi:hypothetical protein
MAYPSSVITMAEYYQVRFEPAGRREKFVADLSALDLFLYYIHPLSLDEPIFLDGRTLQADQIVGMKIVKTDYSVHAKAQAAGRVPEHFLVDEKVFEIEPDVTPHVSMYYEDSPLREKVEALLADLREGEMKLASIDLDEIPKAASEVAKKRRRASEAIGATIGAMIRGYMGP